MNAFRADLGFVIVFGYKWNYEDAPKVVLPSKKDLRNFNDYNLLVKASKLIEKADIVVAHYGSRFDRKFFQGRLLINGLPPIPPVKLRDTWDIARRVANFSSNRLKHLAKILKLKHQKLENNWPHAWFKVMQGDMKTLQGLAEYCKGDVLALEELHKRLQPFDHTDGRIVVDNRVKCGICNGEVIYRGYEQLKVHRYRRWQCKSCGHWGRSTKAEKINS